MSINNGIFQKGAKRSDIIAGMKIPQDWWSRPYEYAWALNYAKPGDVVADMGCGWMYRPVKEALASICGKVYAVDANEKLLEQAPAENMKFIIADITKPIEQIEAGSLDTIFSISVLEDLGDMVADVFKEFKRLLKPEGRIVITCDTQHDLEKPLGRYPGVNLVNFFRAIKESGLELDGGLSLDKSEAIYHEGFNLCCLHLVVKHAENN